MRGLSPSGPAPVSPRAGLGSPKRSRWGAIGGAQSRRLRPRGSVQEAPSKRLRPGDSVQGAPSAGFTPRDSLHGIHSTGFTPRGSMDPFSPSPPILDAEFRALCRGRGHGTRGPGSRTEGGARRVEARRCEARRASAGPCGENAGPSVARSGAGAPAATSLVIRREAAVASPHDPAPPPPARSPPHTPGFPPRQPRLRIVRLPS